MEKKPLKELKKRVSEISDVCSGPVIDTIANCISDVAGSFVPGLTGIIFNYKIHRMEKNLLIFIDELKNRVRIIEESFSKLSDEKKTFVKDSLIGIIIDDVINEQEEEKIKFIVSGLSNVNKESENNAMILYYDLLKNLKLIEIKVLVGYDFRKGERIENFTTNNFSQYLEKLEIDHLMYEYIEEKLVRYKLLENSFNTDLKRNLEKITTQMGQIREAIRIISNNKGSNFQQYQGSLHSNIDNAFSFEENSLSDLGKNFLDFFVEK